MSINLMNELKMSEKLNEISFVEYIYLFGSITDQLAWTMKNGKKVKNPTYKQRVPFKLWSRQREACEFLEGNNLVLMPKSRQKGYSEIAAERCLFTLFKNINIKGAVVSKSEDFASDFLKYRIIPKYNEMCKQWPNCFPKIVKSNKDEIEWEDGRVLKSISCSNTGAASLTLDFMVFDEAGGIDENKGASIDKSLFKSILDNSLPALDQNPDSWVMIIGTSVPGTYYNQLVRKAYEQNNEGEYKYFFIGWHHQPGRTKEWYFSQRERLGDDVYLQHPTDMDDFFYIKDGLVFQHFDPKEGGRHVLNFTVGERFTRKIIKGNKASVAHFKPSWNNYFITSYDHGTNHPAVNLYGLYDKYSDMLYVFAETFFQDGHGSDVDEINSEINKKYREYPIPRKADREIADGSIYNDIGAESVGSLFRNLGRNFIKAKKNDEAASRELVADRFRKNRIYIHEDCVNLITQIRDYRWDAKSKGEKPVQKNDDAIDALRYMCSECRPEKHETQERAPGSYKVNYNQRTNWNTNTSSNSINDDWQAW